ncbi:hypothetical protein [Singulisphaera acidiphila]|uniref:hypothetical protein n=1 Tax=Singulisphaera acidiphila TaxID=466153 RepID=UPI0002EFE525|nr:hypothetical protein [Singulisphaera acidiphila]
MSTYRGTAEDRPETSPDEVVRVQFIGGDGSVSTENQGQWALRSSFLFIIAQWSAFRRYLAIMFPAIDVAISMFCN